jgi:hypothetical protein
MTPEDLDNALKDLARTFVREVKQQDVPLRVNRELAVDIIRTARYQHRDEISLILEARAYIKGRLPVRDRATAVAILLQRDAVLIESPTGTLLARASIQAMRSDLRTRLALLWMLNAGNGYSIRSCERARQSS